MPLKQVGFYWQDAYGEPEPDPSYIHKGLPKVKHCRNSKGVFWPRPVFTVEQDEFEKLLQDAERYRWLREQHWTTSNAVVVVDPKPNVSIGAYCPSEKLLDEYIDKEMESQLSQNKEFDL